MNDKTKEEVDIRGFEGLYKVSRAGEIWSYPKSWAGGKGSSRSHSGKKLKTAFDRKGYEIIILSKSGSKKTFKVHRLIALHFIPNPENKYQVNHKNGNKADNRVENLEWATSFENMRHAVDNDLMVEQRGEKHGGAKITESQALEIISSNLPYLKLSAIYGISVSHISGIRKGKKWAHLQSLPKV